MVVAFILTYCSHCQKTIGALSKIQKDYGARGLQVLASATEDMAAAALPGFLRQFDPPFPVGVNTTDEFITYMQHPTMLQLYMPGLVFIDKAGMIQAPIRRTRLVSGGNQCREEHSRQGGSDVDAGRRARKRLQRKRPAAKKSN